MKHHLQSRYDRLVGRSGIAVDVPVPECYFIYGPRRSGRTTYLIEDMMKQAEDASRIGFFSAITAMANEVRRSCAEKYSEELLYPIRFDGYAR